MVLNAKRALPKPRQPATRFPVIEYAVDGGITLFNAPPGYLSTDTLAALLERQEKNVAWLRLGNEDRDPGTLLVSLIQAARRQSPDFGEATLRLMERSPGPIHGWSTLYSSLASEWSAAAPRLNALVIQHLERAASTPGLIELLGAHFLPRLPDFLPRILITHQPLPRFSLPGSVNERTSGHLRIDDRGAEVMGLNSGLDLSPGILHKMNGLAGGRVCSLWDFFEACRVLGEAASIQILEKASGLDAWMVKTARTWLSSVDVEALQTLALNLGLGYSHPSLLQVSFGKAPVINGPWLQELDDGWSRIRCIWVNPLNQALRAGMMTEHSSLHRAAQFLAANGWPELAIPSLMALGDLEGVGEVIAASADEWMARGQWQILADWVAQLPLKVLEDWPWLLYYSGEILVVQGNLDTARRTLERARKYFEVQGDQQGVCQAMLVENALAVWQNDLAFAQKSALAVLSLARGAGMDQYTCRAGWQAGCLAVLKGALELANEYFSLAGEAARSAEDEQMEYLCNRARELVSSIRNLQMQNESHRQGYFKTQQALQSYEQELRLFLSDPLRGLISSSSSKSRMKSALFLKIGLSGQPAQTLPEPENRSLSAILFSALSMFGIKRRGKAADMFIPLKKPDGQATPEKIPPFVFPQEIAIPSTGESLLTPPVSEPIEPAEIEESPRYRLETSESDWEVEPRNFPEGTEKIHMSVHLLGSFNVWLEDHQVTEWPSIKCRAVFSYLLAHHNHPISKDVLMDVLWPEATLKAARNNLNVALYALRRALRSASKDNLILYRAGAYSLTPQVDLWLDIDEFERHVQEGRQFEFNRQSEAAVKAYETAAELYQGDFLADDLYEEWSITMRQHLRLAYQEILDRLSQHYFEQGNFAQCISMCQVLLSFDNCREDVHCRLMRCYSRQGLDHLALRQYQICESALKEELDVTPTVTTSQLYEQIRRHERV